MPGAAIVLKAEIEHRSRMRQVDINSPFCGDIQEYRLTISARNKACGLLLKGAYYKATGYPTIIRSSADIREDGVLQGVYIVELEKNACRNFLQPQPIFVIEETIALMLQEGTVPYKDIIHGFHLRFLPTNRRGNSNDLSNYIKDQMYFEKSVKERYIIPSVLYDISFKEPTGITCPVP